MEQRMKRGVAAKSLMAGGLGMLMVALAACGNTQTDRALSGGAIGAGAGAAGGALMGRTMEGALIGGAVGAAAGGLTDEQDFDLGRPVWR